MRIKVIIMLFLALCTLASATDKIERIDIPQTFTQEDLNGENPDFLAKHLIITNFKQRLQLGTGKLSKKLGRVLVIENNSTLYITFYFQTDSGTFQKIGRTIAVKNTSIPRQDMHPEYNIPCLVLSRSDGEGIYRVYLYNGNAVIQKGDSETIKK